MLTVCSTSDYCRQGSSDELALLVADFGLLDRQLADMCDAIDTDNISHVDGDDLDRLAVEVPDLRARLGIGCIRSPTPTACPAPAGHQDLTLLQPGMTHGMMHVHVLPAYCMWMWLSSPLCLHACTHAPSQSKGRAGQGAGSSTEAHVLAGRRRCSRARAGPGCG